MKALLALLLLATLGLLATLPHFASANDQTHEGANHQTDHETDNEQQQENEHEDLQVEFQIRLTGEQQVPAVDTTAFGFAEVQLSSDNNTLEFEVVVCNIANVTASHIHVGAAGTNGSIVLPFYGHPSPLFNSPEGCDTLAQGTRTSADLMVRPEAGINNWNDFINALIAGNTYVNVHTTTHPGGEIRGQLVTEHEQSDDEIDDD